MVIIIAILYNRIKFNILKTKTKYMYNKSGFRHLLIRLVPFLLAWNVVNYSDKTHSKVI
jgi:hypothetical protein